MENIMSLPKSIYHDISLQSTISEISDIHNKAKEMIENAPIMLSRIKKYKNLIETNNHSEAKKEFLELIENPRFDNWISLAILMEQIDIPCPSNTEHAYAEVSFELKQSEGCFCLKFPDKTITFGRSLNELAMLKTVCERFVTLIKFLDHKGILSVLSRIEGLYSSALDVFRQIEPKLQKILNNHSRWGVKLYVANLNNTPFLINQQAKLYVKSNDGAKYSKDCKLVVFKPDKDSDDSKYIAEAPVVVQASSGIFIEFVTEQSQGEMEHGLIFREIFASGKSTCWINFFVEKVGMIRYQTIYSHRNLFKQTT